MSEAAETGTRYAVRAVERVVDILDTLQRASLEGVSLVELAEVTQLPKSSVFRYLATLEGRGYVDKNPATGNFTLGVALPSQRQHLQLLARRVVPALERLRDRFGETVNFGVLDGDRVLYVEIVESLQAMRLAARRGDRDYIHSTALGRAIAAELPPAQVVGIAERAGMPARTDRTITRIADLHRALDQVRATGWAIDDEENEAGARCVAVSLHLGNVIGGISVSAPAVRLSRSEAEHVAEVLADEARFLSRRLGEAKPVEQVA